MHLSCAAVVQWISVGLVIRRSGVRISWQTKILKKSLVIRVNSKSASRTGIYLKRTRVKVQLVHAWTGENKCMNRLAFI